MKLLTYIFMITICGMSNTFGFQENTNIIEDDLIIINPNDLKIKNNKIQQKQSDKTADDKSNINTPAIKNTRIAKQLIEDTEKLAKDKTNYLEFYNNIFKNLSLEFNVDNSLNIHSSGLIAVLLGDRNKEKSEMVSGTLDGKTYDSVKLQPKIESLFHNVNLNKNNVYFEVNDYTIFNNILYTSTDLQSNTYPKRKVTTIMYSDLCFVVLRNKNLSNLKQKLTIKNVNVESYILIFDNRVNKKLPETIEENSFQRFSGLLGTNTYLTNSTPQLETIANAMYEQNELRNDIFYEMHSESIIRITLNFDKDSPVQSVICYDSTIEDLYRTTINNLSTSFRISKWCLF